MINLKKHDNVADAVLDILQQEALKGNQDKIDANHNGKIDAQDFKILRGKKKVEEELKGNQDKIDANHNGKIDGEDFKLLRAKKKMKEEAERTEDTLTGKLKAKKGDDVGPGSDGKSSKVKLKAEEVEQIDELSINTLNRVHGAAVRDANDASREGDEEKANKRYNLAGKASNKAEMKNRALGLKPSGQHTMEEVESLEEKNWIANAIKHPGAETAAAKKAGMSTQAYAEKHKHDSGKAGKRARLALTLKHMKEKFEEPILDELINEVMAKDASAGDYIHDFIHSDNPKFAGKSKAKRKEMALAAYYSKKNEEYVDEGLKDVAKKAMKALTGGSDEDQRKDLQRKMGVPQTGKKPTNEEVEQIDEGKMDKMSLTHLWHAHAKHSYGEDQGYGGGFGGIHSHHAATAIENHVRKTHGNKVADDMLDHSSLHVAHAEYAGPNEIKKVEHEAAKLRKKHGIKGDLYGHDEPIKEGWDDMVKSAQEKVKSGPKPNGGSGKKEGSAYGGSKQKEKPEHEMKEAKNPMMDAGVGAEPNFSTDAGKPMKPMKVAQSMAKKSLARMRSEMLGKTGTSE